MKILSHDLAALVSQALLSAFPDLSSEEVLAVLSIDDPRDSKHVEFATGVAMKLSKRLGKAPKEIAEAMIEHFPQDYRLGALEFAMPGFVNMKLSDAFLQEGLKQMEGGFSVERGVDVTAEEDRPVIVEYSSTNAAKHMGVHHIISTVLGDVLANLMSFMGHTVIRINHLGDWGTHFGKIIYAIEAWGDTAAIEANPNDELTRLYVKFHEEAELHPELEEEARKVFKTLEEGNEERTALWKWIVEESSKDLRKIFVRLGVEFDHITGESFYLKMTDEVIADGVKAGVFVEGEGGSLIYKMGLNEKGEEKVPALIRKSDGTTLYLTRDLATIKYRMDTWHPLAILYVVDHAQSLHFEQDFIVAKALGYDKIATASGKDLKTSLEHIPFGRMSFGDRSMSTRKGNILKLSDLLDEAVKRAGSLAANKGSELPREDLYALTEIVGIASVKYAILSQDRTKDLVFAWDKIITLEGNSAPYLLYSYARASSIMQKAEAQFGILDFGGMPTLTEEAEKALARRLLKFPEALDRALQERKPHLMCTALYELCQEFNRFYGNVHVMNADTELQRRTRLGLVRAFSLELKSGLAILGIPVLDRM